MAKRIPIGIDDFAELVDPQKNFLFVDKTLMIKELIDEGRKVSLIIRPRRWGKTLNMSMLTYFFSPDVDGHQTAEMFEGLKISQVDNGTYLKEYQGKHPVIFVSFKNIKQDSWDSFFSKMKMVIMALYREFERTILESIKLQESHKNVFKMIMNGENDKELFEDSLRFLSECLFYHYHKKVMILIDEYDTPLNASYNTADFEIIVNFLRNMFGSSLKGNKFLERGVITGILRLSKNRMLSDLNNLKLYSLIDDKYNQHFGFLEDEVRRLISESGTDVDMKEAQHWYNGYRSGTTDTVYNPWSILNCIDENGLMKPYWIKTGNEGLLRDCFQKVGRGIDNKIISLLENNPIDSTIDEYISFDEVGAGREEVLWSLLWTTGYLKFATPPTITYDGAYKGHLKIPNHEVACNYITVFPKWVRSFNRTKYDSFLTKLISGNVDGFVEDLAHYMLSVPSYFDFPNESNYHTFLLGLVASLEETHEVQSNRESGLGRFDLTLVPRDIHDTLGIILEFKKESFDNSREASEKSAHEGLKQINDQQYDRTLRRIPHIKKILKLCIVFYGKEFVCRSQMDVVNSTMPC